MAKGVRFFMDTQDEREFAESAIGDGTVVFIPQTSDRVPLPEFRRPEEANHLKHPTALELWNKAIIPRLSIRQYAPKIFGVDAGNNDPIIGFRRSFRYENILVAGELSGEMYALDKDRKQLVYKGKDFEQWYNSLARWIRRHYERDTKYGIYIGPSAQKMHERGEIQLAQAIMADGRPI